MKDYFKKYRLLEIVILLSLILFKGNIINILCNINKYMFNTRQINDVENNILKSKNEQLKIELEKLTDYYVSNIYNYELTRVSYRKSYNDTEFYIYGGNDKKFKKGYALINDSGLVGIVTKVNKDYSECRTITTVDNLSVDINGVYGTITNYLDGYFIIEDISNYDNINLNDEVYTSVLGHLNEKLLVGKVSKIDNGNISKKVYVKSKVDFDKIDYLYVVGEK